MSKRFEVLKNPPIGIIGYVEFSYLNDGAVASQTVFIPCKVHSYVGNFPVVVPVGSDTCITIDLDKFLQVY